MNKHDSKEHLDAQERVYNMIPPRHKPKSLFRRDANTLAYEYVKGVHPDTDLTINKSHRVWKLICRPSVMRPEEKLRILCTAEYRLYIIERAYLTFQGDNLARIRDALIVWCNEARKFVYTEFIHGDFTLENIIIDQEWDVVYIDPGVDRGLTVIEMDESKMLQSIITQWEHIHRDRLPCRVPPPFEVLPEHIVLLLSHWIRLLAHPEKHSEEIQLYGVQQVVPLLLEEIDAYNAGRHGRSPSELQAECIRRIPSSLLGRWNRSEQRRVPEVSLGKDVEGRSGQSIPESGRTKPPQDQASQGQLFPPV